MPHNISGAMFSSPSFFRERPDFLQFGLQALDDSSDPRQEAAKESEKEVSPQLVIQLYSISTD